jgi:ubiquinone/menaquinone biosynthesis C-methylase UbiE
VADSLVVKYVCHQFCFEKKVNMLRIENTDQEWEKFGKKDPYYGVLTADRFHKDRMTDEDFEAFFSSGSKSVSILLDIIKHHFDINFIPGNTVDFGCGVGRLTIPLSQVSKHVTAIDVSPSMLSEARRNSAKLGLDNISFVKSDDDLTALEGEYNLFVSEIVFQHIPEVRGCKIFSHLVRCLSKGGIGYVQLTYRRSYSLFKKFYFMFRTKVPGAGFLVNAMRRQPLDTPFLQMNSYDMNKIMSILQENKVEKVYSRFYETGEYKSIYLYFQK